MPGRMRNGEIGNIPMQFVKMVETESFIRYIWVHSSSHCVAIPHPPQFANWGTFPSGEGISAAHHIAKLQFICLSANAGK